MDFLGAYCALGPIGDFPVVATTLRFPVPPQPLPVDPGDPVFPAPPVDPF